MTKQEAQTAKDLMSADVAWIDADMSLLEAAKFLEENSIHGAPVVASNGKLCGVVSGTDIVRAVTDGIQNEDTPRTWFGALDNDDAAFALEEPSAEAPGSDMVVTEIMSPDLVCIRPETTVQETAQIMLDESVHRILVVDEQEKVRGIITVSDLLRVLAGS